MNPNVTIYTDGACENNPGKGGFGIVMMYKKQDGEVVQKNVSKGYLMTTNNRMELMAVIYSLGLLKKPCNVTLYSDSKYVIDAVNKNWLDNWVQKNWKNASKKPVKNVDLWQKFLELKSNHNIEFIMAVKARQGNDLEIDTGFSPENQD